MSDGFPEYKILQKRTDALEQGVTVLRADVATLQAQGRDNRADLDRMILLIAGDEDLGLAGLMERTKSIEKSRRTMALGLAVTSLTGLATFGAIIFQILSR